MATQDFSKNTWCSPVEVMVNNPPFSLNHLSGFKRYRKISTYRVQVQVPFFKYVFSNKCIAVCPYFRSVFKKEKQPKILAKQDTSLSTGKRKTQHGMTAHLCCPHENSQLGLLQVSLQKHIPGLSWKYWTITMIRVMQDQTHLCFHTKWERRVPWNKPWVELGSPCKDWEQHPSWSPSSPSQPGVIPACWSPRMKKHIMNATSMT